MSVASSFIIHETGSRRYFWSGAERLSIKTFSGGRALYDAGGGTYAVDDTCYLVLNHGRPYTITIESHAGMGSFCVFFGSGLVEEVHRTLTANQEDLLDEPATSDRRPLEFVERTYPHDDVLSPVLSRFRAAYPRRQADRGWVAERLRDVAGGLLRARGRALREAGALPAVRASTRENSTGGCTGRGTSSGRRSSGRSRSTTWREPRSCLRTTCSGRSGRRSAGRRTST